MAELFEINQGIQILKPVHEVFEAVADAAKMSSYFLKSSSGRLETGKTIIWHFVEVEAEVPVHVVKSEQDKYLSYRWDNEGHETLCEITFESAKNGAATIVRIKESGHDRNDNKVIKWLKSNTEGWAQFLVSLKGYCEYGINLRKDAYTFQEYN